MIYDENWALEQAVKIAWRSKCQSKRGVVIWNRELGIISNGFNAPPNPFECDGSDACKANCAKTAVHAEQVALLNFDQKLSFESCEMLHVKVVEGKPVHSLQPSCWQCSKLILACGLKSMWLYQKEGLVEYSSLEFHEQTLKNCNL